MNNTKRIEEFKFTDRLKSIPLLFELYLACFRIKCKYIKSPRSVYFPENKYWEKWHDVIVSCYFTSKRDPRRHFYRKSDSYSYIKKWYESIQKLDLHGIIFYDRLSSGFIKKYQTDKIIFIKCTLGFYSTNEERFFIYRYFFKNTGYKRIFITDLDDVYIAKNPFDLIDLNRDKSLFIGSEDEYFQESKWIKKKIGQLGEKSSVFKKILKQKPFKLYNAGIIGGRYNEICDLLKRLTDFLDDICTPFNADMQALNYILSTFYDHSNIMEGSPLNSKFKRYENPAKTDAYIVHK